MYMEFINRFNKHGSTVPVRHSILFRKPRLVFGVPREIPACGSSAPDKSPNGMGWGGTWHPRN